ncbi:MAG: 23S rRNA (adenine(2503)-C(2))-methyltransferase RlmN, partial [Candidatus Nitrosotenuis sp.]
MTLINLKDLSFAQLDELAASMGQPKFRAKQMRDWLYAKNETDIAAMSNLPKDFRERLAATHTAAGLAAAATRTAPDGTVKYLFALDDGLTVETVYIPEEKRKTVCVSTQVGCKFQCAFCATGTMGFSRNLRPSEILNQVIEARRNAGEVTNVVFMGMGEPLDNFSAVTRALEALHSPEGFNIGARRITISTVGLPEQIEQLGKTGLKTNLAISLHAASDAVRTRLMPVDRKS